MGVSPSPRSSSRRSVAPTTSATATCSCRAPSSTSRINPCPGGHRGSQPQSCPCWVPRPTWDVLGGLVAPQCAQRVWCPQAERDAGAAVQPGPAQAPPGGEHHQRAHHRLQRRGRPRSPAQRHRAPQPALLLRPPGTGVSSHPMGGEKLKGFGFGGVLSLFLWFFSLRRAVPAPPWRRRCCASWATPSRRTRG